MRAVTIAAAAKRNARSLLLRCQKGKDQNMPRRAFFVRATRRCARGTTVDPSAPLANQSPSYALRVALVGSAVGLATPLYVVTLLLPSSRLHRPMPKRATVAGEWHLCGLLASSAPDPKRKPTSQTEPKRWRRCERARWPGPSPRLPSSTRCSVATTQARF